MYLVSTVSVIIVEALIEFLHRIVWLPIKCRMYAIYIGFISLMMYMYMYVYLSLVLAHGICHGTFPMIAFQQVQCIYSCLTCGVCVLYVVKEVALFWGGGCSVNYWVWRVIEHALKFHTPVGRKLLVALHRN